MPGDPACEACGWLPAAPAASRAQRAPARLAAVSFLACAAPVGVLAVGREVAGRDFVRPWGVLAMAGPNPASASAIGSGVAAGRFRVRPRDLPAMALVASFAVGSGTVALSTRAATPGTGTYRSPPSRSMEIAGFRIRCSSRAFQKHLAGASTAST